MGPIHLVQGLLLTVLCLGAVGTRATEIVALVDDQLEAGTALADEIWRHAELGYMEEKSSAVLQAHLRDQGFAVESGLAGIPTSFVASYGRGEPVIGILAEFDALPGLSQDAVPERSPRIEGAPGHACGHHQLETGTRVQ